MSDGQWVDSNELLSGGVIATDQLEVMAGSAIVAGGMVPCVMVRVTGVPSENVGVPGAERIQMSFLIPNEDADRVAAQIVEASKARPS